jgi:hypothetical protein
MSIARDMQQAVFSLRNSNEKHRRKARQTDSSSSHEARSIFSVLPDEEIVSWSPFTSTLLATGPECFWKPLT